MKEKYGFVYLWRDKKHSRYYIGCHWGTEDDGYICSSRWMRQSYKRRPQDFKRRVLARIYSSRADLLKEEGFWLLKIHCRELGVKYYNLNNHQNGHWTSDDSKRLTIGQKISSSVKAHRETPEGWANYQAGIEKKRGRPQSAETITKRAAAIKDALAIKFPIEERKVRAKKGSKEHLQKLSEASKRRWAQPLAKEKQAAITRQIHTGNQYNLGRIVSEETRDKISKATRGKKRSAEYVEAMRERARGRVRSEAAKLATSEKMKEVWAERRRLNQQITS